ncbi:3D-(3,5/4)-trihydroxycyclohexane-1,2-dione acylhydrolase (decyclizing) [uncultured Brachyspira sp.]|uniref:3D-(3,5/4)-trihydroxycyclohexane-1,2-dione acylhydrolase (decyclizing) n=1 Tax=uncultured Brachyspira sp. TaxID=221953 RepID=UPI00260CCADC|nr:3D-(3,5/4)-trihydroxycyclohexane-1,2-dione acylhydrolase (decyclizing) [uncultured Brachyspira sp.]
METINMTVGQALTKFLDNQYISFDGKEYKFVEGVFGIFGHGNVVGFGEALAHTNHNLKFIIGRNEQGMAHSATAFARQNRRLKIYACTSSIGPGAMNMVTAAATATANRIPLLLLPGDTYACRQPDPVLQQIEQEESALITANDSFRAVCKYFDRVSRPEQLMTAMINAMRVLTDPAKTGAVCVALPQDVQGEVYDFPKSFLDKRVHYIERQSPSENIIKIASENIKKYKKPLIICGGGARYSLADETLLKFAKKFNIPVGETQAGKGVLMEGELYNLGGIGATGALAANIIAKEADLIIGVGTRYSDFTTSSKSQFVNAKKFININVNPLDAAKLDAVQIKADAKLSLEALEKELSGYKAEYTEDYLKEVKDKWNKEYDRLASITFDKDKPFTPEIKNHDDNAPKKFFEESNGALPQTTALALINKLIDKNAIIVGSSGSLPGDLQRMWKVYDKDTYHVEYAFSCMGYEVNGAYGAKLAYPDREVYAMTGDGSFIMGHSEIASALAIGVKINVIVFDNAGFGCINNLQRNNGIISYGTEFKYDNGNFQIVDFAKIAEGYGMVSYKVKTLKELEEAIEKSKKETKSTLIDIKVMPKTMTDGYESFWRVGVAQASSKESVLNAAKAQNDMKKHLIQY